MANEVSRPDGTRPLTVWYNTKCPVCDAGIRHQKSRLIEAVKAGRIEFLDINLEPDALAHFGAGLDDVRRRLHATDEDGRLLVGADVALAVWRRTPGQGWIATLLGAPGIIVLTRFAYDRFADLLFAWNKRNGRW
ncbi:thiol-disulfide oxidoreductase [Labrys okinawensis]|uniref:Thiol-disulfide oxidoreductase n=1 Tax=Labrys okinawensis TaxID=346911 RepID=A0A2S9Q6K4_9HYPH|nr:DCC1-like thiol-disulfide oxidoreductase family protein [Labrys okinawensis]PRH84976.1 thiol-disulfide oxidoreductase [Labrys okinawensis]